VLSEEAPSVVEFLPAPHSVHVLFVEAPAVAENLPAPQSVHVLAAEAPMSMRYLPSKHSMQMLAEEALSVTEYLPASQSVHTPEPISILYLPATHGKQGSPSCPVNPLLHRQLDEAELPLEEIESAGHAAQVSAAVAAVVVRYFPVLQLVHTAEPMSILCCPFSHAVHVSPFPPVNPGLH